MRETTNFNIKQSGRDFCYKGKRWHISGDKHYKNFSGYTIERVDNEGRLFLMHDSVAGWHTPTFETIAKARNYVKDWYWQLRAWNEPAYKPSENN